MACNTINPDEDQGPVIDGSQNTSTSFYFPTARDDNPMPVESQVFVRHFFYFTGSKPWTILSTGNSRPTTIFEETAIYLLRLGTNEVPIRLAKVPVQTDGVTPPRVHVAVAAPSIVILDGLPLTRNTSGAALVYRENGPLYGGFSVDVADTQTVADQFIRLLADTRVRIAALASDGLTAAYVNDIGQLYILNTDNISSSELLIDIRSALGSAAVTALLWQTGSLDTLFLRIDRGRGPESWGISINNRQLFPSTLDPRSIQEPGSDQLPLINELTTDVPAVIWRVPSLQRFE